MGKIQSAFQISKKQDAPIYTTAAKNAESLFVNKDAVIKAGSPEQHDVYLDSRYYTIAGYEPNAFEGTFAEIDKRIHPDDLERVRLSFRRYIAGELESFEAPFRFLRKDGKLTIIQGTVIDITERKQRESEMRSLRNYLSIFLLVANGVEGAVIRVDDITDQVRMEEMMIQSEKMLTVGGLAAGMAHEINNPLASMLQTANVMQNRLNSRLDIPANQKTAEKAGITLEGLEQFMEARSIPRMLETIVTSGKRVAEIVVESEPGAGAKFIIRLPLRKNKPNTGKDLFL
ncbi:PAS domain-containing protein [uncultured Desulfobacter sp.]|uniref:PAS domain-containing protein n=1 Tax=uncultured Desulfobacter sp. TaxID=240139 RepID=UPI0029F50EAA|nr:PAS domain-containing protein [uncultured Desulfobacter sp.]